MSKTTTRTILGAATLALAFQTFAAVLPPTRRGRPKPAPQPQPCTTVSKIGCLPMPPVPKPATPPAPRTGK